MKTRIFTCGALMSLWLATLAGQARVVADALAGAPALTESAFWLGIASIIPHLPGLLLLGAVCAAFRDACYIRGPLGTDQAAAAIVLMGDAIFYFAITYWIARAVLRNAARRGRSLQMTFVACGACLLMANGFLTGWMVWIKKPYYVHPMPRLSILSVIFGALTLLSAFWPAEPQGNSPAC